MFCLSTEEIKSVKKLSTNFVQGSNISALNTGFVYILVPFNDPGKLHSFVLIIFCFHNLENRAAHPHQTFRGVSPSVAGDRTRDLAKFQSEFIDYYDRGGPNNGDK